MLVHSLWDQEDIYGATAVYKALEPKDSANDKVFLVLGPWYHGQEIDDGSTLGALRFESDTALWFRQRVLRPFLDHYLKDGAPKLNVAPVTAFETGAMSGRASTRGRRAAGRAARSNRRRRSRSRREGRVGRPSRGDSAFDEYVSDPAKPVPFRKRPIQAVGYGAPFTWEYWLVDDQREQSGRDGRRDVHDRRAHALEAGKIKPGSRLMLVGFGVGYSWGGTMAQWV